MFTLDADIPRNLLVMTFSGDVLESELKGRDAELESAISKLRPEFRLLGDMTDLSSIEPACLPYIRRNMDLMNQRGVSKVVRVIPDPHKDIGFNILSVFHYRPGIPIVNCKSLDEAREALAG